MEDYSSNEKVKPEKQIRNIMYRIAGNFSEIETLTIFASRHENVKV